MVASLFITQKRISESWIICRCLENPRHPVIFSDDWDVQSPPKPMVFRFHYHSQKVTKTFLNTLFLGWYKSSHSNFHIPDFFRFLNVRSQVKLAKFQRFPAHTLAGGFSPSEKY